VFGVPASYLVERDEDPSVLDKEVLAALADETANAVLRESARLPEREKRIVLGIAREFGEGSNRAASLLHRGGLDSSRVRRPSGHMPGGHFEDIKPASQA
jgi:DNA-binding transcriptional ArsR family regulator